MIQILLFTVSDEKWDFLADFSKRHIKNNLEFDFKIDERDDGGDDDRIIIFVYFPWFLFPFVFQRLVWDLRLKSKVESSRYRGIFSPDRDSFVLCNIWCVFDFSPLFNF